jgi:hypothetical protein
MCISVQNWWTVIRQTKQSLVATIVNHKSDVTFTDIQEHIPLAPRETLLVCEKYLAFYLDSYTESICDMEVVMKIIKFKVHFIHKKTS